MKNLKPGFRIVVAEGQAFHQILRRVIAVAGYHVIYRLLCCVTVVSESHSFFDSCLEWLNIQRVDTLAKDSSKRCAWLCLRLTSCGFNLCEIVVKTGASCWLRRISSAVHWCPDV